MKNSIKVIILLIIILLLVFPFIRIKTNNKLIEFSYSEDFSKYEEITCYDDGYSYYEKEDITIKNISIAKFLFFYKYTLEYVEGNKCEIEYLLEEEYINDFIENAYIKSNPNNINISELIKGKSPIIGNVRYSGNDYQNSVEYILNGRHNTIYIFNYEDLLVIQVGLSDEGPKFIAYR